MKKLNFFLGLSVLFFCFSSIASAAKLYECELRAHTRYGWIPSLLYLSISDDEASAFAYDYFINSVYEDPISVSLEATSKKLTLRWTVENMSISNRRNKITGQFKATLRKSSNRINMQVLLDGADFVPHGSGTCRHTKSFSG